MITTRLKITLELAGPVMTKSTTLGGYGIDSPMAQSGGHYYLPGSLVKGRLREALQELCAAAPDETKDWTINDWFGVKTGNREEATRSFEPGRARILFDDFRDLKTRPDKIFDSRYRIRIDPTTKAVKTGALQLLEAPYASGVLCSFESDIRLFAGTERELDTMTSAVNAGLRWITSLGAERSVGFGRVNSLTVKTAARTTYTASRTPVPGNHIAVALHFARPIAIATRRKGSNLFESEEVIPGAAIRGAIAQLLDLGLKSEFRELARHLSQVRITHAFPAGKDQTARPNHFPLSIFDVDRDASAPFDAALLPNPPDGLQSPPAFQIDWKDPLKVPKLMGWPTVKTELRVRTAVRSEDRKQRDTALFGTRMIQTADLKWLASVDLSRVDDAVRPLVAAQLAGIFDTGLPGIGKTRAFARTECAANTASALRPRTDGKWIVCLQTPALLLSPMTPLRTRAEMETAYRQLWSDLSGQSLQLDNYFQSNTLAGGDYLHRRFRSGHEYRPYLLTSPGSVFVFSEKSSVAADKLEQWLHFGLPLPPECRSFYCDHAPPGTPDSDLWACCPYIPENGFGEIAVNLPIHEELAWHEELASKETAHVRQG